MRFYGLKPLGFSRKTQYKYGDFHTVNVRLELTASTTSTDAFGSLNP